MTFNDFVADKSSDKTEKICMICRNIFIDDSSFMDICPECFIEIDEDVQELD